MGKNTIYEDMELAEFDVPIETKGLTKYDNASVARILQNIWSNER